MLKSSIIDQALERISFNNIMPPKGSKIAIAMSGGVDSSVTAALLSKLDYYEIFGITGWLIEGAGKCCDGGMIDAAKICESLGIEHQAEDLRQLFQSTIISPFISSYQNGRTPVPCMPCNTEIKWGSLLQKAKEQNSYYLASGHYARLIQNEKGEYCIGRSKDQNKDQSYMLWGLNQKQLKSTVFPLANFEKAEIRELANELGLENWNKEDSQDICFVPNKTKDFLQKNIGEKTGQIKHIKTNEILGQHSGTHFFTIGQRKGIGLSNQEPLYIIKIDALNNIVYAGEKEYLQAIGLIAEYANWQTLPAADQVFKGLVKIRYNSRPVLAEIKPLHADNQPVSGQFEVKFLEEISGITPGQAAVIYDLSDNYIMGGGWIKGEV
jgi:tRNA-uridine 2-sulfurtransferase